MFFEGFYEQYHLFYKKYIYLNNALRMNCTKIHNSINQDLTVICINAFLCENLEHIADVSQNYKMYHGFIYSILKKDLLMAIKIETNCGWIFSLL